MDEFALELRAARRQRILYFVFALSLLIATVICGALFYAMSKGDVRPITLGPASRFAVGQPIDVAVKQLETSKLIPTRSLLSEDVIFVVKQADGRFRAWLGVDPVAGCFLSWQADQQHYTGCSAATYDVNGRNTDQLFTPSSQPVNMIELPTEVRDQQVFVLDQIVR